MGLFQSNLLQLLQNQVPQVTFTLMNSSISFIHQDLVICLKSPMDLLFAFTCLYNAFTRQSWFKTYPNHIQSSWNHLSQLSYTLSIPSMPSIDLNHGHIKIWPLHFSFYRFCLYKATGSNTHPNQIQCPWNHHPHISYPKWSPSMHNTTSTEVT